MLVEGIPEVCYGGESTRGYLALKSDKCVIRIENGLFVTAMSCFRKTDASSKIVYKGEKTSVVVYDDIVQVVEGEDRRIFEYENPLSNYPICVHEDGLCLAWGYGEGLEYLSRLVL